MTNNRSPERLVLRGETPARQEATLPPQREALARQVDALARRLDGLERQNRRLKQILVASVVLLGAVGSTAQVAPSAVTSDRFVLVDAQNRTRATLDTALPPTGTGRYPVLTFLDPAGKPRLRLGLGSRGALLEIVDESGKVRDYFGPFTARPLTQP
jgi:hypothetical protein